MAILVQYLDNSYGHVRNHALDELIERGRIVAFRRADGWADIGKDPIRLRVKDASFTGVERRDVEANRNCLTCPDFIDSLCQTNRCSLRKSMHGRST